MKQIIAIVLAVIAGIGSYLAVTYVGKQEAAPVALAVGVQNTVNTKLPDFSTTLATEISKAVSVNGSAVTAFEIDGSAYRLTGIDVTFDQGLSRRNREKAVKRYTQKVMQSLQNDALPQTAEVDLLYALTAMSNSLQNTGSETEKKLLLVTNLLSTAGAVDFTKATIYFDTDNYVENLKQELPNMKDIAVTFYVTEGAGKQTRLENSDTARLKKFYTALCTAAGARSVDFIEDNGGAVPEAADSFPAVSTVNVRHTDFSAPVKEDSIDLVLEESATFLPDSVAFVDEEQTTENLKRLVDTINRSSDKTLIVSTTATTSSDSYRHLEFAMKRSKKVYDKLVKLGADKDKLEFYSLGKEQHPYRVPDSGKFASDENKAKNRCVFIVSAKLEKAKVLKKIAKEYRINR